jgi:predicted NAD/FAD-dependent oxidoreductase
MTTQSKTLIIGAGISGLLAGKALTQAGHNVTILEKSRGVGGRMATRRYKDGIFDFGAQFFTARDPEFQQWVDLWLQNGVAREWSLNLSSSGSSLNRSNRKQYKGVHGMTSITKELSQGLKIQLQTQVTSLSLDSKSWIAQIENGRELRAGQLILTSPVPQALDLLQKGDISLPDREFKALQNLKYHPCIALLVLLDGASGIPAPGGVKLDSGPIQWLGDNRQKGISPEATAITIHASKEFSHQNYDHSIDQLAELLLAAAEPWLGNNILDWQLHKWRYSQPTQIYPKDFMEIDDLSGLFIAGDAFGGPRIEGAALSGLRVASHLL